MLFQKASDVIKPNEVVAEKLKKLPSRPGVYLWKDGQKRIIYVGKAKRLPNRVRSYFQSLNGKDFKTRMLVSSIRDLDWIVTDTEKEALILENNLIKKYRPRYNVSLRDDKNFKCLRLSTNEDFPKLSIVRKIKKDEATYFGPFSNSGTVQTTLNFLKKTFPLRKCPDRKFAQRDRPCLNYQIGQCEAPCNGRIEKDQYQKVVRQVILFFEGKSDRLSKEMVSEMERASKRLEFEKAARLRDAIRAINATLERQKMVTDDFVHRDVFGLYREGGAAVVSILYIRNGTILGHRAFPISNMELPDEEIIASVIKQYYGKDNLIPHEIILDADLGEEGGLIQHWLSETVGRKVAIIHPQRGRKTELLNLARKNAFSQFEINRSKILNTDDVLQKIQRRLKLRRLPRRIECFDVSNLQGTNQVASQVCFIDGEPDKSGYRLFKIKTVVGQDDFGSMREVLHRRFKKSIEENPWPDLVMIDGGKGQLNIALSVLRKLEILELDVIAFTKIRSVKKEQPEDMVYLPGRKNPVHFKRGGDDLFMLQRVRDESHRFAIEFHRKLRLKQQRLSLLDRIPGVGQARKKALLKHFGSIKRIKTAKLEEISAINGIPIALAVKIHEKLNEKNGE